MEKQSGDEQIMPFAFDNEQELHNIVDCYVTYTNAETHKVILENLHRSPLYSGRIEGIGPRYCPSIEDKIVRFKDKERHQLFVVRKMVLHQLVYSWLVTMKKDLRSTV